MEASPFETKVRHHRQGVAVIDLTGEINPRAEEPLIAAYEEALTRDPTTVLLNFEAVDYINSRGIAIIVGIMARARKEGRKVFACGLSDHYREIFEITRLADFMQIFPDEASAIAGVPATT